MAAPTTLNMNDLPVKKHKLDTPPLADIAAVFQKKLLANFEHVQAEVVACPNLTSEPFNLAAEGFGGNPIVIDLGAPAYLLPLAQRDKIYDLRSIPQLVGDSKSFIVGAGAGPWPLIGTNCEMIINEVLDKDKVHVAGTRVSKIVKDGKILEILPSNEWRVCLLANIFSSRGEKGNVLKVHCKKRIGEKDFVTSLRLALNEGFPGKVIGLGGVFLIATGKVKQHVMPDFSKTPLTNDDELNKWLKFFEMSAPLSAVGTMVSADPGLDLRVQHFHSFGKTEGGHYHYDVTPDVIEYVAYLSVADTLIRVDQPKESGLGFGHD